jgi:hypothetical protein
MTKDEALKLALEAQEPVAWQWLGSAQFRKKIPKNGDKTAWNPLYTAPPQRPWVGLTNEQIDIARSGPWGFNLDAFTAGVRFAEAAHDIKENT